MRRLFFIFAVSALLLFAAPTVRAEEENLYEKIKIAIKKGVEYLKTCQNEEGGFGDINSETLYGGGTGKGYAHRSGLCAFALYALLKCGVKASDPVIRKGFAYIDKHDICLTNQEFKKFSSYELSTMILALEAKYDRKKRHNIRTTLEKSRKNKRRRVRPQPKIRLSKDDAKRMQDWVDRLISRRAPYAWRYNMPGGISGLEFHQDMSGTQFAMLALRAASRCQGIEFDRSNLYEVIKFIFENQEADGPKYQIEGDDHGRGGVKVSGGGRYDSKTMFTGKVRGFMYHKGSSTSHESRASGGMTTAAIASLLIIKSLLISESCFIKEWEVKVNQSMRDGLQWVDRHWSMAQNPGRGGSNYFYYYLYGLERCGDLQGTLVIGKHYWYNEGAEVLVRDQKDSGAWIRDDTHMPEDVINTAFALLFLDRATPPVIIARYG